ncbi:MAG TPA: hypothetical protein VJM11_17385 [Nevskiaceae bacterium]|nr:hypothetical protein [Nevskiaceae bacterium]
MSSPARLTPLDERFLHQIPYTLDTVCTTDPDFRERIWMSISDARDRSVMIDVGMGHYVNRNVQEGWAGITVGSRQHNFRASRHLRPDLQTMAVGPLRVETPDPLRKMRYVLEDNPSGLAFDVTLESTLEPHVEEHHLEIRNGKVVHDLTRYNLVCRASGVASWPGGSARLDPEHWFGGRDHSWGLQPDQQNVSQPTQHVGRHGTLYTLLYAQFRDWGAFLYVMERMPGIYSYLSGSVLAPAGSGVPPLRVVGWEHDYHWKTGNPVVEAQSVDLTLITEDGGRHPLSCAFYEPRYFLRSALYMGWKGWWQGADKGPLHVDHDVWDLGDAALLPEYAVAGGGYDHHAVARSSTGEVGHAAFEYFVTPGYPRYAEALPPRK